MAVNVKDIANTRAHGNALCWAARIVSLVPSIWAIFFVVLSAEWGGLLVVAVFFIVPAVLAWRWHFLGGIAFLVPCGCFVYHICSTNHPFDLQRGYFVRAVAPFLAVWLVSSVLHILVWWKEASNRG